MTGEDNQRGGGAWEPIKIPYRNLAFIPKLTRRLSLLTRSIPPSYRQAIDPRNQVRNTAEIQVDVSKTTVRLAMKIRLKIDLCSHKYFTEHLVDAFGKPPRKCNLNCKTSRFLIWQLKNKTGLHLQKSTQEYTRIEV
jgi:hypothetical protein